MEGDESSAVTDRFGIDGAVIERTAQEADLNVSELVGALDVLHAELIGRHSNLERDRPYVTVDGVRAYRVDASVWDEFLAEFDLSDGLEAAVRYAHTEQAKLLFAKSVKGNDNLGRDEEGVVIGIDTAEQF